MSEQSWVLGTVARSVSDEPDGMVQAAENRRRIMGSNIFGNDDPPAIVRRNPPPQQQRYEPNSPPASQQQTSYQNSPPPTNYPSYSNTMPVASSNFPEINFDSTPPMETFDLGFKPKPVIRSNVNHRLQVPPNPEMRALRDELTRDTEQFARRLREIGQL